MVSKSTARLSAFLVEAKRRTYAGLDDDATVSAQIFPGSKQLEHHEDDLSYRDIYFGMMYFVGQEVVQADERVIWSMSYAGGLSPGITDRGEFLAIYAFLRKGLLGIHADRPFRGPSLFEDGHFRYVNTPEGDISEFRGEEEIYRSGERVYGLRYSGGIIR
ncbi:DUF5680 domain-containing protein [Bradyrhizobium sp. URHD0069]|uniref:DUF5680 domain-containing protein n=1 Tax=Bradyrhizobium sp. URHD0069 TaxID=1380355 RepID=UPI000497D11B|nr:DUF5680 domain-containing protein [Bradyrhizobium sp. URHD0069]